jgi:hypothetical protein
MFREGFGYFGASVKFTKKSKHLCFRTSREFFLSQSKQINLSLCFASGQIEQISRELSSIKRVGRHSLCLLVALTNWGQSLVGIVRHHKRD